MAAMRMIMMLITGVTFFPTRASVIFWKAVTSGRGKVRRIWISRIRQKRACFSTACTILHVAVEASCGAVITTNFTLHIIGIY